MISSFTESKVGLRYKAKKDAYKNISSLGISLAEVVRKKSTPHNNKVS